MIKKIGCLLLIAITVFFIAACNEATTTTQIEFVTVTFDGGPDATINPSTIQVERGRRVAIPDAERFGYRIGGWFLDRNYTASWDFNDPVMQNKTLFAFWIADGDTAVYYTVSFDSAGGSEINPMQIRSGQRITRPEDPIKEHYTFDRWQLNGSDFNFNTPITVNIILTAVWNRITEERFTVTFDSDGGTFVEDTIVNSGDLLPMPQNPRKNYHVFLRWELNGLPFDFSNPITSYITLVAVWQINQYTVTFDSVGGSYVQTELVKHRALVETPEDPTKEHYTFVRWELNGEPFDFNSPIIEDITLIAVWQINQYTVTFDSVGGSYIQAELIDGKTVLIRPEDPTKEHYTFVRWELNGLPFDFNSPIINDIILIAVWQINQYTVTFDPAGGSYVQEEVINSGTLLIRPEDPIKDHHTFVRWELTEIAFDFNTPITASITLIAIWQINEYTVTFETDGGSFVEPQQVVAKTIALEPLDPVREHYTFVIWELNGLPFDFNTAIIGDITLIAFWQVITFTVTFDSAGGSAISAETVNSGTLLERPTNPIREHHTFVRWELNGSTFNFNNLILGSFTLIAIWQINEYTVTFDSAGGSFIVSEQVVAENLASQPANPTRAHHTFLRWELNGLPFDFNSPITESITLVAIWQVITFTVTFDSAGGSAISAETVNSGSLLIRPIDPTRAHHTFIRWELNGSPFNFNISILNDIALIAVWQINEYTVTFNTVFGSFIVSEQVVAGQLLTRPTDPTRAHHTFLRWELNGLPFDFNSPIYENITLVAVWQINEYTVTFDTSGGSLIESQQVTAWDNATQPANPTKEHHTFLRWERNGIGFEFFLPIYENTILVAIWQINVFTVTFNSDGGSLIESQTVNSGNLITSPTNPNRENYIFVRWELNGLPFDFNTPITANITLIAIWQIITFTVTFDTAGGSAIESVEVNIGSLLARPTEPTKEHYSFVRWELNGEPFDFNSPIINYITLEAIWQINEYTVTFNTAGGSVIEALTVNSGTLANRPTNPIRAHHTFLRWELNELIFDFNTVIIADITLIAIWLQVEHVFFINSETNAITGADLLPGTTDLIIPSVINGIDIFGIGASAFANRQLRSVIIPDSITSIANNAFQHNQLTTIEIPSAVTSIGINAFSNNIITSLIINSNSLVSENRTATNSLLHIIFGISRTLVQTVVIGDTVTHIGNNAFINNNLINVTISNSVVAIGSAAFDNNQLTSIEIPSSVTSITGTPFVRNPISLLIINSNSLVSADRMPGADLLRLLFGFSGRDSIETLELGDLITTIGSNAFTNNYLTNVVLPNSLISIGGSAFAQNQIRDLIIPNSVTTIEDGSFSSNQLKNIIIPNSVTSLGGFGDNQLTTLVIPNSVVNIGSSAFNNNQLTSIEIPSSVTNIGNNAFANNAITSATINSNSIASATRTTATSLFHIMFGTNRNLVETLILGDSVVSIGSHAFRNNNLTSVIFPDSLTNINISAFQDNRLTSVALPPLTVINHHTFANNQLTYLIIPTSVTAIEFNAFENNLITSIEIPSSLTNIMNNAFGGNPVSTLLIDSNAIVSANRTVGSSLLHALLGSTRTSVETLIIGESVTNIGNNAFADNQLVNVTISDSVTSIGNGAFENNQITNVILSNAITTIGNNAFNNNELLSIVIPELMTTIGTSVFANNQLSSIIIPDSITTIGNHAFQNNQLTSLIIPDSVLNLPVTATFAPFAGNNVTTVTINHNLANRNFVLNLLFGNNNIVTTVLFSENVTSIGNSALANSQLTGISIPNTVTSIGNQAFENSQLANIVIPESVTSIGNSAFRNNRLTSLIIPETVLTIGNNAFADNLLTTIIVPDLIVVPNNSSEAPFLGNPIHSATFNNNDHVSADRAYSPTNQSLLILLFGRDNKVREVILGESITSIGNNAFRNNQLTSVTFSSSITSIGTSAFENNQLVSINLPNSIINIGLHAFRLNQIADFTISQSIVTLGGNAFQHNEITSLVVLHMPTNLPSAFSAAFNNNPINTVSINGNFTRNDFLSLLGTANNVISLYLGDDMTTIDAAMFDGWNSLVNVTIPNSITNIGWNAFGNRLMNIRFHGTQTEWNNAVQDRRVAGDDSVIIFDSVNVQFNSAGGSFVPLQIVDFDQQVIQPTDPTRFNFVFIRWELNGLPFDFDTILTRDSVLTARWQELNIESMFTVSGSELTGFSQHWDGRLFISIPSVINGVTITSIGEWAFGLGGYLLESVIIPDTVTHIGAFAFVGNRLTNVTIPSSVISIANNAFASNLIVNVTIPDSVISLGNLAFNNNRIANLVLSNSLTSIGNNAFANNLIANVTIPDSVLTIGNSAFSNNQLRNATIPNTVTSIGVNAFSNTNLTIRFLGLQTEWETIIEGQVAPIDTIIIFNSVIIHFDTAGGSVIESIFIDFGQRVVRPADPTRQMHNFVIWELDGLPFDFNTQVTTDITLTAIWELPIEAIFTRSGSIITGFSEWWDGNTSIIIPSIINGVTITGIGAEAFRGRQLTSVIIPNTITDIGRGAFWHNQLTNITIPDSVIRIGANAFAANQLTSVIIPNSVISIGMHGFASNNLSQVFLSSSLTMIEMGTFENNQLTGIHLPNTITSIGNNAFRNNRLSTLIIPNSVISIWDGAFRNNSISGVWIGNSVITLSAGAFDNTVTSVTIDSNHLASQNRTIEISLLTAIFGINNIISNVTLGSSVTSVGANAFRNSGLTTVTLSNSITTIGNSAFRNNQLTNIVIPSSLRTIPTNNNDAPFRDNPITQATIDSDHLVSINRATSVGNSLLALLFHQSNSVNNLILGPSVRTIGYSAFRHSRNLSTVFIPTTVTTIRDWAFSWSGIRTVTMGPGVTHVLPTNLFHHNDAPAVNIRFMGTQAQWNNIFVRFNWTIGNLGTGMTFNFVP